MKNDGNLWHFTMENGGTLPKTIVLYDIENYGKSMVLYQNHGT